VERRRRGGGGGLLRFPSGLLAPPLPEGGPQIARDGESQQPPDASPIFRASSFSLSSSRLLLHPPCTWQETIGPAVPTTAFAIPSTTSTQAASKTGRWRRR